MHTYINGKLNMFSTRISTKIADFIFCSTILGQYAHYSIEIENSS